MANVGDKARVTKGHPVGYEDIITRIFLAASGNVVYQLGYNFVQCLRDEFEVVEHTTDVQYRIGDTVLYSCEAGEPPRECPILEVKHMRGMGVSEPSVMYYIRAGYADFQLVHPSELTPVTYSLF